ncbi:hypothetical protein HC028_25935 [Planosporangium flavigriseum]|uniref:Uncharacterized protein n=1 Tax=Planosporangium flavigriseum TaxID=373681 RepID=A0A8J3LU55_9ACTN|nr:hypothetical protein [Planosporangium flavigriseum]NJC67919.1 hypothetical protein [Planosporangium flavigriseum]GIG76820.1 hypothetical protein Pfl04_52240 [Planosporangium flavigriseum]
MTVLLVLTFAMVAVGLYLMAGMLRRDEPALGMIGLMVLQIAGFVGAAYGVLGRI